MKQGLKAELNPKTGKPRVVSIEKTSKVELETMTALEVARRDAKRAKRRSHRNEKDFPR